ncbi:MAG TPA: TIGR04086 family membrane protein [Actinomycetota bacterium]|jgi:hypothetical protein|nr:TIGR04086 family membrane protein [Actinomycetota bacterium]
MRDTARSTYAPVRGGISLGGILTGVVVAFGAMFLLSALLGGILTATGVEASELQPQDAGIAVGIGFVVIQFLSYLWGGYTAGRMARGAGLLNGLLVPVGALLVAAIVAVATAALGAAANLNLPFGTARLPVEDSYLIEWGRAFGLLALAAMFLGGIIGGMLGSRWHSKLEAGAAATHAHDHPEHDHHDHEHDAHDHHGHGHEGERDRTIALDADRTSGSTTSAAHSTTPPPPDDTSTRRS